MTSSGLAVQKWPLPGLEEDWRGWRGLLRALSCAAAAALTTWAAQRALSRLRRARRLRVEGLYIYPIKGCRGHSVAKAEMTPWGLKGDRRYMIVNAKDVFVTQAELPRMSLIHPELPTEKGVTLRATAPEPDDATNRGVLTSTPPLLEPLFVPRVGEDAGKVRPVVIWDDSVPGVDQGDAAAKWLQAFLGKEGVRLVLVADSAHRATNSAFGVGETAFADGFPILLTSEASVQDLNGRLGGSGSVGVDNFRPNIHVSGCRAFEEDEIRAVAFHKGGQEEAEVRLHLIKPCARCTVPTVDVGRGARRPGGEPLRTLRSYRTAALLKSTAVRHNAFYSAPDVAHEAYFGQNALIDMIPGAMLEVGLTAEVEW